MSLTAMPYGRGPAGWPTVSLGIFADLPVAVALVTGPDLVVQAANDRYLALVGGEELAGRSLSVALPEFSAHLVHAAKRVRRSTVTAWPPSIGRPTWAG